MSITNEELLERLSIVEAQLNALTEDQDGGGFPYDTVQNPEPLVPPAAGMVFFDSEDNGTNPIIKTAGYNPNTGKKGMAGLWKSWDTDAKWLTTFKIPFLPKDPQGSGELDWSFLDTQLESWKFCSVEMVAPNVIQLYNFNAPPAIPSPGIPVDATALIRMKNGETTNVEYGTQSDMQKWLGMYADADPDIVATSLTRSIIHRTISGQTFLEVFGFDAAAPDRQIQDATMEFMGSALVPPVEGEGSYTVMIRTNVYDYSLATTVPQIEYADISQMKVYAAYHSDSTAAVDSGSNFWAVNDDPALDGVLDKWLKANFPHSHLSDILAGNAGDDHLDAAHGGIALSTTFTYLAATGSATRNAMTAGSFIGAHDNSQSISPDLRTLYASTNAIVAWWNANGFYITSGLSYYVGAVQGQTVANFSTGGLVTGNITLRHSYECDENTVYATIT